MPRGDVEYNRDLFEPSTIERLMSRSFQGSYSTLSQPLINESAELEMFTESERRQQAVDQKRTQPVQPPEASQHDAARCDYSPGEV